MSTTGTVPRDCGMKLKSGCTVKVRVDEATRHLGCAVNNEDFKTMATIKNVDIPYYFAIGACDPGDSLSFTNYSCTEASGEVEHQVCVRIVHSHSGTVDVECFSLSDRPTMKRKLIRIQVLIG